MQTISLKENVKKAAEEVGASSSQIHIRGRERDKAGAVTHACDVSTEKEEAQRIPKDGC
jgi:hypothetical protein